MDIRTCKHCKQSFSDMNPKVFSNHVRWCYQNPNRNKTQAISEAIRKCYEVNFGVFRPYVVVCHICGVEFEVQERDKKFPSKEKYYCSRSCANRRMHSQETKQKTKKSVELWRTRNGLPLKHTEERICGHCNGRFETTNKSQKCCSRYCGHQINRIDNERKKYYHDCRFKFNVYDFPDKFDIDLLTKYGWYKAVNHGNNPVGISRDHKISIYHGWENGIPAEVISHPANCQLLKNPDNQKKRTACSITLDELYAEIAKWAEDFPGK